MSCSGSDRVDKKIVLPCGAVAFSAHGTIGWLMEGNVGCEAMSAGFREPRPLWLRCRSSFTGTSNTRCRLFSIDRCARTRYICAADRRCNDRRAVHADGGGYGRRSYAGSAGRNSPCAGGERA